MNNKTYLIDHYRNEIKRFYQNENGVYTVMTALLSFALLGVAALAVDGSGILLDKARLTQGMEQGALAVIAENNEYRKEDTRNHADVTRQTLTAAEKKGSSDFQFKRQQEKRNQELAQGFVQVYLPNVKINDDFNIKCAPLKDAAGRILKSVGCDVSGDVDRPSWLYLTNHPATFEKEVEINSGVTKVKKRMDDPIPLDVILVSDLTGSMETDVNGKKKPPPGTAKIDILKRIVASIGKELLEEDSSGVKRINPYNRIGYIGFAYGAQQPQPGNTNNCYLPYLPKAGKTRSDANRIMDMLRNFGRVKTSSGRNSSADKAYGNEIYRLFADYIDYDRTVNHIRNFNGTPIEYDLVYTKRGTICLSKSANVDVSRLWYKVGEHDRLAADFRAIMPAGGTLSSTGLLIGANALTRINQDALPSKVKSNTQRILLILSDGKDEFNSAQSLPVVTETLINKGACDRIRERLDSFQDSSYPEVKSKVAFVTFGNSYNLERDAPTQKKAWDKCVGAEFYRATNEEQLLQTFRKILGLEEEVGTISN